MHPAIPSSIFPARGYLNVHEITYTQASRLRRQLLRVILAEAVMLQQTSPPSSRRLIVRAREAVSSLAALVGVSHQMRLGAEAPTDRLPAHSRRQASLNTLQLMQLLVHLPYDLPSYSIFRHAGPRIQCRARCGPTARRRPVASNPKQLAARLPRQAVRGLQS